MKDPFIVNYQAPELKIAAEFLTTWLPFLTRDLCNNCTQSLSTRVLSLDPDSSVEPESLLFKEIHCDDDCDSDTNSLGSWKDTAIGSVPHVSTTTTPPTIQTTTSNSPNVRLSWADMAQEEEDELEDEDDHETDQQEQEEETNIKNPLLEQHHTTKDKVQNNQTLSREQREYLRFKNVERNKDFICLERVKGKIINILDGLELHTGVFSAAEQKRIVDCVYNLEDKGRKGELRERTFSAPQKWMRGKGRVTIQFGCCYNYAVLKDGNPPGILRDEHVDPIPQLFKVIIRRLIGWHILPPTCVPDSCIVNIYDEGDCIPPHIDNHDFIRPFCTVSFLSECNILFGSNLKAVGPGDFSGAVAIPLPVGSVLVLNGNGADVAKHCVPAVPTKRISITFRKMDETKRPFVFVPEPDLQGLQPLPYDVGESKSMNPPARLNRQPVFREIDSENGKAFSGRGSRSEPRYSGRTRLQPGNRRRTRE